MTLTELLPHIRQLPSTEKLRLIRLLAEDLDRGESGETTFTPNTLYLLATPYNTFGVAEELMRELQQPAERN